MDKQEKKQYLIQVGTIFYRRTYRYQYIGELYPGEPYFEPDIDWIPCIVNKIIPTRKINSYDFEMVCYASDYAKVNFLDIKEDQDISKLKVTCKVGLQQLGKDFFMDKGNSLKKHRRRYMITPCTIYDDDSNRNDFLIAREDCSLDETTVSEDKEMYFECDLDDEPLVKDNYNKFNYPQKYLDLLDDTKTKMFERSDNSCSEDTNISGRFSPYCNFVKLHRQQFDFDYTRLDDIFYFKNYYPIEVCKKYNSEYYWHNNNLVLNFKRELIDPNTNYNSALYFYKCIENRVSRLEGNWIVCSMPAHNQVNSENNAIKNMMDKYCTLPNVRFCNDLLIRTKENLPKNEYEYGTRDYKKDLETLRVNDKYKYTLPKANVIILDDIVTSGASFIAAKKLLLIRNVANVVCMAFAKTITEFEIENKYK